MQGFLCLDKPVDWTSFDVVARIRHLTGEKQVGHSGTLDPLATGILIVAVGKMTRLLEYMVAKNKTYTTTWELGKISDTYDAKGVIRGQSNVIIPTKEKVLEVIAMYTGNINQVPPAHSAIKIDGKRAYTMARNNETVIIPPRAVTIQRFSLVSYAYPFLTCEIECSAGTYIRSLAHDIGCDLGTGGMVTELRRTHMGVVTLAHAKTLELLTPENIQDHFLSVETLVSLFQLPVQMIRSVDMPALRYGKDLYIPEGVHDNKGGNVSASFVLLLNEQKNIIGMGKVDYAGKNIHPEKVLL